MKTSSELTDFYYKTLFPILEELEKKRKHLRYRLIVVSVIYTLVFFLLFLALSSSNTIAFDGFGFLLFAYIGIGGFLYKFLIKDYTQEFKLKVIEPLINELDENLNYSSKLHVPQRIFEHSQLFKSSVDRFNGNDFVRGHIDGVKIQFSDIHAEHRTKNSKNKNSWQTIFKGLFIVSDFNKSFKARTIILPDTAQSTFGDLIGGWLQSNNVTRDALVKMDDPEFEKHFVVYSTDQIEARYILSHALMKKLTLFHKKSEHPLYISFVGESIHMAIEYDKDLFEPSIFRSLLDYKIAMEYVKTLHLAISIVEELKLNQKLWSKI